jgi:hypothetical protein
MIVDSDQLQKPWLAEQDRYARIAHFVTYGVMFLGVILGAIKVYFDYKSVPVIPGNLCVVLDEEFNDPSTVFGDNGTFFREVDMSGFGCVSLLIPALSMTKHAVTENSK